MVIFDKAVRYKGISFHYGEYERKQEENEIHRHLELLYLLDGEGVFITEDHYETVKAGTLFVIPELTYHNLSVPQNKRIRYVTVCIRGYNDERNYLTRGMKGAHIITDKNSVYIQAMNRIADALDLQEDSQELRTWLYAMAMAMLSEMKIRGEYAVKENVEINHSPIILGALKYIEENLCTDITIDTVAKAISVSSSTLYHSFKKEMGIPIYKYLMQKRLTFAGKLISQGERPTEIYFKCGFNDYSTFYRAYRNMFGITPTGKVSKKKRKNDIFAIGRKR